MDFVNGRSGGCSSSTTTTTTTTQSSEEEDMMLRMMDDEELKRGPWTVEEDLLLVNYIANHGEGRWNSLAQSAGLKRTGKSCRLRWLNYLRPDVRRGNITPEEQLMILELHYRWGNRWSKIAQYLPGRTDNEIKNYWRTRVQKHAKQLRCDVNSKLFKDTMRYIWMPRLAEKIRAAAPPQTASSSAATTTTTTHHHLMNNNNPDFTPAADHRLDVVPTNSNSQDFGGPHINPSFNCHENSSTTAASSDSFGTTRQVSPVSDLTDHYYQNYPPYCHQSNIYSTQTTHLNYPESLTSPSSYLNHGLLDDQFQSYSISADHEQSNNNMWPGTGSDDLWDNLWNPEDIWFLQQQL